MKRFRILLFLTITTLGLCAQNTNPLDKRYSPPSSSLFGPNKAKLAKEENLSRPRNMFELPLLGLFRKEISMKYELKLSSHFSASGLIGKPFGMDAFEIFWHNANDQNSGTNSTEENCIPLDLVLEASTLNSGLLYSFSLKYYSSENDNTKYFYELGYKNVKRNYLIQNKIYTTSDYMDNMHYMSCSFGMLWVYGKNKIKFTHEFSIGLGFKVVYWDTYTEKKFYSSNEEYQYSVYNKNLTQAYYQTPYLSLRYCIGFGF